MTLQILIKKIKNRTKKCYNLEFRIAPKKYSNIKNTLASTLFCSKKSSFFVQGIMRQNKFKYKMRHNKKNTFLERSPEKKGLSETNPTLFGILGFLFRQERYTKKKARANKIHHFFVIKNGVSRFF